MEVQDDYRLAVPRLNAEYPLTIKMRQNFQQALNDMKQESHVKVVDFAGKLKKMAYKAYLNEEVRKERLMAQLIKGLLPDLKNFAITMSMSPQYTFDQIVEYVSRAEGIGKQNNIPLSASLYKEEMSGVPTAATKDPVRSQDRRPLNKRCDECGPNPTHNTEECFVRRGR